MSAEAPATLETRIDGLYANRNLPLLHMADSVGVQARKALDELSKRNAGESAKVNDKYADQCDSHLQRGGEMIDMPAFSDAMKAEMERIGRSNRAAALAQTHLQTGLMWLRRAITNPEEF